MDLQRSLLIGAAAVLSFMLLTEWVAFKEAREVVPETASRMISDFGNVQPIPDQLDVALDSGLEEDDIPTAIPAKSAVADAALPLIETK